MSAYFIAQIKINDIEEYNRYLESCDDVFSKYNGQYLAIDSAPEVLEGGWNYSRSILIQFPNKEDLKKWYYSVEYQEILKHRLGGSDSDTIIIEG